jgi:hypothetical protein
MGLLAAMGHLGGFLGMVGVQAAGGYALVAVRATFATLAPLLLLSTAGVLLFFLRAGSVTRGGDAQAKFSPLVVDADTGL